MSLKKSITTRDGIEHPNAYFKLVRDRFDYVNKRVSMSLSCWHDQAAKEAGKATLSKVPEKRTFSITDAAVYDQYFALAVLEVEGVNERKKCYEYLKTQITGTEDV